MLYGRWTDGVQLLNQIPAQPAQRPVEWLSPNGKYVAYVTDFDGRAWNQLMVIGADGHMVLTLKVDLTDLIWLPDSSAALLLTMQSSESGQPPNRRVERLDLHSARTVIPTKSQVATLAGMASDGSSLYATRTARSGEVVDTLVRLDLTTGMTADLIASPAKGPYRTKFHTDGDWVAFVDSKSPKFYAGDLVLAHLDGTEQRVIAHSDDAVLSAIWDKGHRWIAYATREGIFRCNWDGTNVVSLLPGFHWDWTIERVSDDGTVWVRNDQLGFRQLTAGQTNPL